MKQTIKNITNENEYDLALAEVKKLIDINHESGTKDSERLEKGSNYS